jgi:hypothetical protein
MLYVNFMPFGQEHTASSESNLLGLSAVGFSRRSARVSSYCEAVSESDEVIHK